MPLDQQRLSDLIDGLCARLSGDWVLIGGALVALWLSPRRTTEDIDLVGMQSSNAERLQLMNAAAELGLPIEVVNSAADYFLRKIPDWQQQLVLFRETESARIFRPTVTLFVQLKLARLSEQDLADCRAALGATEGVGEVVDRARLKGSLDVLPPTLDSELAARRATLRQMLESADGA